MDNGHGGGKYGKWEVYWSSPGGRKEAQKGFQLLCGGRRVGRDGDPEQGAGGVTTLAGTRQRDVGEFFCLIRFFGFLCMKGADWP